jgi:hypothetical protein
MGDLINKNTIKYNTSKCYISSGFKNLPGEKKTF